MQIALSIVKNILSHYNLLSSYVQLKGVGRAERLVIVCWYQLGQS
jgi:hypothetical protein